MLINNYSRKINKMIKSADEIYIMGHKYIDLDALGACLGMYYYTTRLKKDTYIIIDDDSLELSSKKVVEKVKISTNIIRSCQINDMICKSSLLILVDFNKKSLAQSPDIIDYFENIIIIDHHDTGCGSMDGTLAVIDTNSSSTCEMVSDFLYMNKYPIKGDLPTYLLAGIVLDTNNFVVKSSANTFKIVHLLTEDGAYPKKVQYILKQDLGEYIERQKVITNVEVIGNIAFTKGIGRVIYKREDLAKIADTLLFFNKIEASFVMGSISKEEVGISARSMGNINVGKIMEQLNGGGNLQEAATIFSKDKRKEMEKKLLNIIELL